MLKVSAASLSVEGNNRIRTLSLPIQVDATHKVMEPSNQSPSHVANLLGVPGSHTMQSQVKRRTADAHI